MAMTDLAIIRRSLRARWLSTVLTILMVGVAVALLLVMLSLRDAGARAFERGSGNMHLVVSRDESPLVSVLNAVFYANPPRRALPWSKYVQIRDGLPLEYAIPIQQGDSFAGFPVLATTPEFFTAFEPDPRPEISWTFRDGRPLEDAFDLVLGARVADATGLAVGERVYLTHGVNSDRTVHRAPDRSAPSHDHHDHGHDHDHDGHDHGHDHDHDHHDHGHDHDHAAGHGDDHAGEHEHEHDHDHEGGAHVHEAFAFDIVGILERTGGPHDRGVFAHLDGGWIVHAHERRLAADPSIRTTAIDDLTDEDRLITAMYLRVVTREGRMMSGALQVVFDILRRDPEITVAEPGQEIRTLFEIIGSLDRLFIAMAVIVLISSAVAVMLALYNSMEQRRRQLAILRVLGMSRGRLFGLVLTESACIGIAGVALGLLMAAGGTVVAALAIRARLGLVVDPAVSAEWLVVVAAGTIVLAALAGLLPAIMAYRTAVLPQLRPTA